MDSKDQTIPITVIYESNAYHVIVVARESVVESKIVDAREINAFASINYNFFPSHNISGMSAMQTEMNRIIIEIKIIHPIEFYLKYSV